MKILLFVGMIWISLYFDRSDSEVIKRNFGNCPKNGHRTFAIECEDWCLIKWARANFKKGGRISVVGRAGWRKAFTQKKPKCGRKCFCRGVSKKRNAVACKRHKGRKIKSTHVHFDIRCKKLTKKLRFTVNAINIKKSPTTKNGVLVKEIGSLLSDEKKFFRIKCKGKCDIKDSFKDIYVTYKKGGDITLIGSTSSKFYEITSSAPDGTFCHGTSRFGDTDIGCVYKRSKSFESFSLLVHAEHGNTDNVKLHLKIGNLLSVTSFNPVKVCNCTGSQMTGACDKYGDCLCNPGHSGDNCTPDK